MLRNQKRHFAKNNRLQDFLKEWMFILKLSNFKKGIYLMVQFFFHE